MVAAEGKEVRCLEKLQKVDPVMPLPFPRRGMGGFSAQGTNSVRSVEVAPQLVHLQAFIQWL